MDCMVVQRRAELRGGPNENLLLHHRTISATTPIYRLHVNTIGSLAPNHISMVYPSRHLIFINSLDLCVGLAPSGHLHAERHPLVPL